VGGTVIEEVFQQCAKHACACLDSGATPWRSPQATVGALFVMQGRSSPGTFMPPGGTASCADHLTGSQGVSRCETPFQNRARRRLRRARRPPARPRATPPGGGGASTSWTPTALKEAFSPPPPNRWPAGRRKARPVPDRGDASPMCKVTPGLSKRLDGQIGGAYLLTGRAAAQRAAARRAADPLPNSMRLPITAEEVQWCHAP
jgi:hypothetical protein